MRFENRSRHKHRSLAAIATGQFGVSFTQPSTLPMKYYRGIHGNLVVIDASFEDIESPEGKVYLRQLGIDYLIPALFPDKPVQVTEPTPEKAKV